MKNLKTTLILTAALATTIGFSNVAMADTQAQIPANYKVAVVNVAAVVESSSEVMALKKEQQLKLEELQKWLTTVRADVEKQSTAEGKAALIKKYDAEFAKRQQSVRENYGKKLQAIDKHISNVIEQERKAKGYDLVLAKGVVLSGGTDITKDIAKKVK